MCNHKSQTWNCRFTKWNGSFKNIAKKCLCRPTLILSKNYFEPFDVHVFRGLSSFYRRYDREKLMHFKSIFCSSTLFFPICSYYYYRYSQYAVFYRAFFLSRASCSLPMSVYLRFFSLLCTSSNLAACRSNVSFLLCNLFLFAATRFSTCSKRIQIFYCFKTCVKVSVLKPFDS